MRKRRNQITFYIDEDDVKIISRIKEKTGMSFGEYMRNQCRDIPVKVFPKMDFVPYIDELKDIGYALNELKMIYYKSDAVFPERIEELSIRLDTVLNKLRDEINTTLINGGEKPLHTNQKRRNQYE